MPLFILTCVDKPNSAAVRMAAREDHLAYVRVRRDQVRLGGPLLDEDQQMIGSMLILETPDRQAVEAFAASDPYGLAGLFQSVDIQPFRVTIGALA